MTVYYRTNLSGFLLILLDLVLIICSFLVLCCALVSFSLCYDSYLFWYGILVFGFLKFDCFSVTVCLFSCSWSLCVCSYYIWPILAPIFCICHPCTGIVHCVLTSGIALLILVLASCVLQLLSLLCLSLFFISCRICYCAHHCHAWLCQVLPSTLGQQL